MPSCRRVCVQLLDGLAGSPFKREDAAMGWYWTPWMTSWLWVETIRLPVLPRSGPVYKTGASAARPSRKSAAHGSKNMGSPGVAPGVDELRSRGASPCGRPAGRRSCRFPSGKMRRLRVGCTVSPILWALKENRSGVAPPHRFLLMSEASCC